MLYDSKIEREREREREREKDIDATDNRQEIKTDSRQHATDIT